MNGNHILRNKGGEEWKRNTNPLTKHLFQSNDRFGLIRLRWMGVIGHYHCLQHVCVAKEASLRCK